MRAYACVYMRRAAIDAVVPRGLVLPARAWLNCTKVAAKEAECTAITSRPRTIRDVQLRNLKAAQKCTFMEQLHQSLLWRWRAPCSLR